MEIILSPELEEQLQRELATGRYKNRDELVESAVRQFLSEQQQAERRIAALRRIGDQVDRAGLYERTFVPGQE